MQLLAREPQWRRSTTNYVAAAWHGRLSRRAGLFDESANYPLEQLAGLTRKTRVGKSRYRMINVSVGERPLVSKEINNM